MTGIFEVYSIEPVGGNRWTCIHKDFNYPPSSPLQSDCRTEITGDIAGYPLYGPDWTVSITSAKAVERATLSFLKKARQVQVEWSAPTFLGELREALKMIRSPAKALRGKCDDYLKALKKAKNRNPKTWRKTIADSWLEHSFGWVPLISDIATAHKAYDSLVNSQDDRQVAVTGYGVEEKDVPSRTYSIPNSTVGNSVIFGDLNRVSTETAFCRIRGMMVRRVDATTKDKLARIGFQPSEFIPTAWNLLPWSFLVDYFSNIGDVLEASVFDRSLLSWANISTVISQNTDVSWAPNHAGIKAYCGNWYVSSSGSPSKMQYKRRTVTRTSNISIGTPSLSFELPGTLAQFANMGALFASAGSIHPQRFRFR
jgi:hypothetical protein